jgi:hypothetical protein
MSWVGGYVPIGLERAHFEKVDDSGGPRAKGTAVPVPAVFRGRAVHRAAGRYVPVAETVEAFAVLVEGKLDHISEQAFYNKGGLDDVLAAAKELGVEGV